MSFKDLKLNRQLLRAVAETGYDKPTSIQERTIPFALTKKDVISSEPTRTGKNAPLSLNILQSLYVKQET